MGVKTRFKKIKGGQNTGDPLILKLATAMMSRAKLAAYLGKSYGGNRDLYEALGYITTPTYEDFWARYERGDIAKRIIEAPIKATWRKKPVLTENHDEETPLEKAWINMVRDLNVYHYLIRADKLARIGEYSVLFLGLSDGQDPEMEAGSKSDLLFLRPYSQPNADIVEWVEDTGDPRYGMPLIYSLTTKTGANKASGAFRVHHSRVIHLAEDCLENDTYGTPQLLNVLNRLQDLELVAGSSAEMFWRGAFPGYGLVAHPDATFSQESKDALADEIEDYVHGLKRYMRLQNMDVEELAQQVASPDGHVEILLQLISGATGIPKRILVGSERGELASSQDESNWNTRIDERREDYAESVALRPLIKRLIEVGALPPVKSEEDGFDIDWPDLFSPSQQDQATIAKTKTDTLTKYADSNNAELVLPRRLFLKKIMNLDDEEIDQIEVEIEALEQEREEERQRMIQEGVLDENGNPRMAEDDEDEDQDEEDDEI
jgi:hypothetical protein